MQFRSVRTWPALLLGLVVGMNTLVLRPAAAVGRRLDLATMTAHAGTIVAGRIVTLQPGSHPKYHNIGVLLVTVQVSEMIKGAPADKFTFMQFAGRSTASDGTKSLSIAQTLPELPPYRVGEEVVLFLYPPSSAGFTSPVGGPQGKFLIQRPQGQSATVISAGGNSGLAVSGPLPSHLTPDQQVLLQHPGAALSYKTFRAAVKGLASSGK